LSDVTIVPIGSEGKNLAVCFTKTGLLKMKEGGTYPVDLMTSAGPVKMMFMRDSTFANFIKKFNAKVQVAEDVQATNSGIAEAASLGLDLGDSASETKEG